MTLERIEKIINEIQGHLKDAAENPFDYVSEYVAFWKEQLEILRLARAAVMDEKRKQELEAALREAVDWMKWNHPEKGKCLCDRCLSMWAFIPKAEKLLEGGE